MAKTLANYDPLVQIPSGMTPAGADFPIVESHDILVGENDKRLDAKLDDIDSAIGNVGQTPIATQLSSKVNTGDIVTSVAATGSTSNNKIPSETAVRAAIEAKTINVDTTVTQGSTNAVSGGAVHTQLATKQDTLTFDTTPTASSSNPVTSGGVKSALDTKQDTLTFDTTPTASSSNPVTSGGVKAALDNKQNTLTYETTPIAGSVNPVTSTGIRNAIDAAAAGNLGDMQAQYAEFVADADAILDRASSLSNGMVACSNIAAETTAGDTRILLYTGTTNANYTNGHWYYNSAPSNQAPSWTDGGAVGSAPTIDNTLTTAGAAADSKSVGDAIENIVTISNTQPGSNSGNKVWIKETTNEEVQVPTYEEHISKSNKADIATNNENDNGSGTITASKAYAIGDHFYINNTNTSSENFGVSTLYKATAAIASGDAIVVGTNCEASKVADEITSLSNDIDTVKADLDSLIGDDGNLNTDGTIWESGSLINATGAKQDNAKLIRSGYLPQNANIFKVDAANNYYYKLFVYSASGVYQGCFADDGTISKPSSSGGFYNITMDITAYRTANPTQKIKAALYHNNADMSPSEYTALEVYASTEKGRIYTIEDNIESLNSRVDALGELVGGENLNADGSIWESGSIKNSTGIKQDNNQFINSGYLPQNANIFKVDAANNYYYKLFVYNASGVYQGCFVDETTVEKSQADGGFYKVDFDISAYRAANPTHKIKAELWHKGSVMTADEYTALEAYESLEKGRITSIEDGMNTLTDRVDDIDDTLSAADLSEISDPEIETEDDDWAKGSLLAMTGGYNSTSTWALRSVGYLPDTIDGVSVALEGYSYMLLVYQSDGTYVGLYDTNGTVYKPSTNFKFQSTRIDLRAYKTANPTHKFKLCIRKNSEETIAKSEHTAISLHRIRLIDEALIKGETSKDYVFIAASNAPEWQKNAADYICTGTGDAALIRQVLNSINYNGTVKLSFGTFYLDTFVDCTDGVKRAIPLPWMPTDGEPMKTLTIEGSCGSTVAVTATRLLVTDEAYAALSGLTNVPEIIGASASGPQAPETQNRMGLFLKHVSIMTLTNDNPLIGVNLERIGRVWIEDVRVYAHDPNETYTPEIAAQGSVGIRMTGGSNVGSPTMFMSIIVSGWYEGFQVGGEHVIMLNCAALCCYYGYTFGNYPFVRGFVHPNTLINCCDERNVNLPLFNQAGRGYNDGGVSHYPQAINIMDFNMERTPDNTPGGVLGNKATVINEADFVGTITFHSTQGANPVWQSFFEPGQGYGFRVRDLNAPLSGTKQERGNHVRHNQGTMFFDTTSNKMLWSINGQWIDVNGTVYQD